MKNNKVNKLIARYNQETVDDDESNLGMGSTSYIHHVDQQAGDGEVDYIVNHLRNTASRGHKKSDSRHLRNNNHRSACVDRESSVEGRSITSNSRVSLEDNYCRAMNRLSRGNPAELYYNNSSTTGHDENKDLEKRQSDGSRKRTDNKSASLQNPESRRKESSASGATSGSNTSTNSSSINDKKKAAAAAAMDKDPSEETIAIFGAYGVTGHHFLQLAMEAGYKIRALLLPGLELDDVVANDSVKLITGSFDEEDKVRRVVKNASYVVCLLNDCERSLHNQTQDENLCPTNGNSNNSHISTVPSSAPSFSSSSNLGFFQKLIPILEESKTCRVLLYQVRSYLYVVHSCRDSFCKNHICPNILSCTFIHTCLRRL